MNLYQSCTAEKICFIDEINLLNVKTSLNGILTVLICLNYRQ